MPKISHPLAALSMAILVAACGSGGTESPAGSPSPAGSSSPPASPSSTPASGGLEHPTGATDIVLRLEEGGGFVPMEFNASQAPTFTLYGDGRIVFKQLATNAPEPGPDGVTRSAPWRTAQLDSGQIEELLTFALAKGGLGAARESYIAGGMADVPNTIFTVNAGGVDKTVVVSGLGMDTTGNPDASARIAFSTLSNRLHDFDNGGTLASEAYVPTAYRGVLIPRDPDPLAKPMAWPWPSLTAADFKEGDGSSGPGFPHRSLTVDEVTAVGLGEVSGGEQGAVLKAPDGKAYSFILRPLLPEETE
jgi:hypothetical protein